MISAFHEKFSTTNKELKKSKTLIKKDRSGFIGIIQWNKNNLSESCKIFKAL